MMLDDKLGLNFEAAMGLLTAFIKDEVAKPGFNRVIVGLSGGLDSSVVVYLSERTIGKENVVAAIMPYKTSNPENIADAHEIAAKLGIKVHMVDISPQVDRYFEQFPDANKDRRGNKMARERMSILYDLSVQERALVIGTSNKTEILLGYGTIYGDLACAINPLGDLYKTQVRILAQHLGVPQKIIDKAPSADLFAGQTDEGDYGFTYKDVDRLLFMLIDERYTPAQCEKAGYDKAMINRVMDMIIKNQFKRSVPVIAKLSNRTVGIDFRYPRDWGK